MIFLFQNRLELGGFANKTMLPLKNVTMLKWGRPAEGGSLSRQPVAYAYWVLPVVYGLLWGMFTVSLVAGSPKECRTEGRGPASDICFPLQCVF